MLRIMLSLGMLLFISCSLLRPPPLWEQTVPKQEQWALTTRLAQAGANRVQLEKAYELTPRPLHPYLTLLIERMPPVDLAACRGELLANTVIMADSLRRVLPYAAANPEAIFRDYILPLRVSQEPLEDFRPFFLSQLYPLVKDCTTVEGAAVAINKWCGTKVGFKSTQSRDQGPFETLKSGYGRCEEMMIFFSDACRSLGVPAREAWTPWWTYQDNNHAWTEVWTPEGWKYAGACEPSPRLNQAWFSEPVTRAAMVVSAKQGKALAGENLYRAAERSSLLNVTANYTTVSDLKISLVDKGKPLPQKDVYVSIFNYGSLRPLARLQTDSLGMASLALGKGDYVVSDQSMSPNLTLAQHRPPVETILVLEASRAPAVADSFWLRYDP
jgi:hypothetical protein